MGRTWELSFIATEYSDSVLDNSTNCWADLPSDITLMILMKLRAFELLEFAQFVCQWWYYLCKHPSLWHTINIPEVDQHEYFIDYKKMFRNAIDRSDGGLTDLNIENFDFNEILPYVASRSSQLKRLRLAGFGNISAKALTEAIVKLPSLVELELTGCSFRVYADYEIIPVIKSSPFLTTFKCNKFIIPDDPGYKCDEVALAIGGNMPQLRHLQLIGNDMTNVGLTAILDGCPRLQSLDLRACSYLFVEGNLLNRLSEQIKDFRGPNDSTEDYNYYMYDNCDHYSCNYRDPETSDGLCTKTYSDFSDADYGDDDYYYYFEDDELDISYTNFGNNPQGELKKHRRKK